MTSDTSQATNRSITERYDEYIMPIWKALDVPIKRAHGCEIEDFDGNTYLDLFSGISVTNAGHTNQAIVDRASDQLERFVHGCSYLHPNRPVAELAERIADITPGELQQSFLCNSGTEAVEGAIKLARKHTGNKEVIALEMGFHGRTLGSLALTGNRSYKAGMAPTLNDVAHAPAPYAYRCPRCDGHCTAECASDLEQVIGTHTADDIAAVIVEPVMGEGGIIVPSPAWLERVAEITHDHGGLLVLDEVQTGYGRTGTFFAAEQFDITPDILTQAKGIANGLPLGAFTAPNAIAESFTAGDHLSTFGGNPVACEAALATIDALEDGLIDNASEQGAYLKTALADLEDRFAVVGESRGIGLMHGIEVVDPAALGPREVAPAPDRHLAKAVAHRLREDGIVVGVGGYHSNVLRLQPPLSIERESLERAVEALGDALAAEVGVTA